VVSYLLSSGSPYCGLAISATNPVRVQAPTKVSAKLAPNQRSLTDGAVAVDVTVKSNTGLTPNGTVTVTWKGGAKSAILKKSAKGKMRIELPSLPAKKVNLSIEFTDPTTRFASSQAKKLPVAPSQ
jgi:hypothetical protein